MAVAAFGAQAFACQVLSVEKELELAPLTMNQNGGSIAVGHPLAASAMRLVVHLSHELRYLHSLVLHC